VTWSPPRTWHGKIYFSSEDGEVFVIRAGSKYELLASNPMGEVLMATPAISKGVLFVVAAQRKDTRC
jgi:hypothetical protein